jgi:hypothetical protein
VPVLTFEANICDNVAPAVCCRSAAASVGVWAFKQQFFRGVVVPGSGIVILAGRGEFIVRFSTENGNCGEKTTIKMTKVGASAGLISQKRAK